MRRSTVQRLPLQQRFSAFIVYRGIFVTVSEDTFIIHQGSHSKHFIFFVSYKFVQLARVSVSVKPFQLVQCNTLICWAHS